MDPTSRYRNCETILFKDASGAETPYLTRRFCPRGTAMPLLSSVTVRESDRLDILSARSFGLASQYWRIVDANDGMNPRNLTAKSGRTLRIPVPEV